MSAATLLVALHRIANPTPLEWHEITIAQDAIAEHEREGPCTREQADALIRASGYCAYHPETDMWEMDGIAMMKLIDLIRGAPEWPKGPS